MYKQKIRIKFGSFIEIYHTDTLSKGIRFVLQTSSTSISSILTSDLKLIDGIVKKLKSLINDANIGFEKFEINEDEFISLVKSNNNIQINVKSGDDFTKNGTIGFMTNEQAKILADHLEEFLQ